MPRGHREERLEEGKADGGGRQLLREIEGKLDAAEPGVLGALGETERAEFCRLAIRVLAAREPAAWSVPAAG